MSSWATLVEVCPERSASERESPPRPPPSGSQKPASSGGMQGGTSPCSRCAPWWRAHVSQRCWCVGRFGKSPGRATPEAFQSGVSLHIFWRKLIASVCRDGARYDTPNVPRPRNPGVSEIKAISHELKIWGRSERALSRRHIWPWLAERVCCGDRVPFDWPEPENF